MSALDASASAPPSAQRRLAGLAPEVARLLDQAGWMLQRRDATVVQLRLNPDALQRWLKDPLESVRHGGRYVE